MVPTMPPFSRLGRSFFPGREKRTLGISLMWGLVGKDNIWDLLGMGIGEALMQCVPMCTLSGNLLVF